MVKTARTPPAKERTPATRGRTKPARAGRPSSMDLAELSATASARAKLLAAAPSIAAKLPAKLQQLSGSGLRGVSGGVAKHPPRKLLSTKASTLLAPTTLTRASGTTITAPKPTAARVRAPAMAAKVANAAAASDGKAARSVAPALQRTLSRPSASATPAPNLKAGASGGGAPGALSLSLREKDALISQLQADASNLNAELEAQAEDNAHLTSAVEEANAAAAEFKDIAATAQALVEGAERAHRDQMSALVVDARAQALDLAAEFQKKVDQLNAKLATANAEIIVMRSAAAASAATAAADSAAAFELCTQLRAQVLAGEEVRRELHNLLHALKGNIRVVCRLRPAGLAGAGLFNQESGNSAEIYRTFDGGRALELSGLSGTGLREVQLKSNSKDGKESRLATPHKLNGGGPPPGSRWTFSFDKVFEPASSQAEVFAEVAPLCQSALDGYKVVIFAYGQTGSGKTHTMLGDVSDVESRVLSGRGSSRKARRTDNGVAPEGSKASSEVDAGAGVIPRALGLLFQKAEEAKTAGWAFEFEASLLEVYNEELRDLLPDSTGPAPPTSGLALQHGLKGDVTVTGLTSHAVHSQSDATTLLAKATAARTTAKTSCNEHSSRSHSICVLRVSGFHQESGERVRGCLSLVDLAGSERIKESGVSGARLKEAQSINKSLSALGDVIAALAAKEKHIPFRNSKLTSLLQPSLGGASKALMVVNVAADPSNWNESLCSLRFAQKVSGVSRDRNK